MKIWKQEEKYLSLLQNQQCFSSCCIFIRRNFCHFMEVQCVLIYQEPVCNVQCAYNRLLTINEHNIFTYTALTRLNTMSFQSFYHISLLFIVLSLDLQLQLPLPCLSFVDSLCVRFQSVFFISILISHNLN